MIGTTTDMAVADACARASIFDERNLFLAIAKLLCGLEFAPGKDKDGNAIVAVTNLTMSYSEGFLVCAKPYALEVKVRSEKRRETIFREFDEAKKDIFSAIRWLEIS